MTKFRKWLYDNPWIWVVLFLTTLVAGSMVTLVIAQLNRPEIVKVKTTTLNMENLSPTDSIPQSKRPALS